MHTLVTAVAFCFLLASSSLADVRVLASPGGNVAAYVLLYDALRATGQRIIIDGPCLSACTLVLSLVPRDRVCVTNRAVLGFHAPYAQDRGRVIPQPAWSEIMLDSYPAPVRRWIERHGGLRSRVLLLRGRALATVVPRCRA